MDTKDKTQWLPRLIVILRDHCPTAWGPKMSRESLEESFPNETLHDYISLAESAAREKAVASIARAEAFEEACDFCEQNGPEALWDEAQRRKEKAPSAQAEGEKG